MTFYLHSTDHCTAINTKQFNDISSVLQQDIQLFTKQLQTIAYLVDKLSKSTGSGRVDTAVELTKLLDTLQDVIRKSLLSTFHLQVMSGQNTDLKLRVKKYKQDLDRSVERFCVVNDDAKKALAKYYPMGENGCVDASKGNNLYSEVEYRKKSGTFSSIQEEVDNATELMKAGVEHVIARNSVITTHIDVDMVRESDRYDTTNLQRCYKKLMAKKRLLLEAEDSTLTMKQRGTKAKLICDIDELARMYDDLNGLVDEQMDAIDKIEGNVEYYSRRRSRYEYDAHDRNKKCIIS